MTRFKFRLQKFLDMKIELEEHSKIELKKAQVERSMAEDKLNNLESNYRKFSKIDKKESIIEFKIRYNYLNALNFSILQAKKELKLKEENVISKLEKVKKCQIERKTVETLKEKSKQAFIFQQNIMEQKINDELALYGYIRNVKGGEEDAG